jgi:hypothetical protein
VTNWRLITNNTVSEAFELQASSTAGGATFSTQVITATKTGAVTFGPASGGSVQHTLRSGLAAGTSLAILNKTAVTTGTTSSYFVDFLQSGNPEGYIWHDASGNMAFANASDARLKQNIREITGLDKCLALHPVMFDWIDETGSDNLGFIAQEVEQVLPKSVGIAPDGDTKVLSLPSELMPILVKAIQEQQAIIESLKSRIDALEVAR